MQQKLTAFLQSIGSELTRYAASSDPAQVSKSWGYTECHVGRTSLYSSSALCIQFSFTQTVNKKEHYSQLEQRIFPNILSQSAPRSSEGRRQTLLKFYLSMSDSLGMFLPFDMHTPTGHWSRVQSRFACIEKKQCFPIFYHLLCLTSTHLSLTVSQYENDHAD